MMDPARAAVVFYAFFWIIRINGCVRRGRQPHLRGPEWFFNVHVPPGFADGPGQRLLRWYWMRMMIPFVVDIPIAIWIFVSGRLMLLNWLVLGLCALIHLNHVISVDLAERQARPFAVDQPVAAMMLSLTTRRLRDYASWRVEVLLLLTTVCALIWRHDLRAHWPIAAMILYAHLGLVLLKRLIVVWRTPVPREQAAEHIAVRDAKRKYYLATVDGYRVALTVVLVEWAIRTGPLTIVDFGAWLAISLVVTVLVEIKRKQLVTLSLRARPVVMPDFLRQSEIARWPVCFQPSAPMPVLKGARGYSINLGRRCAVIGLAYVAGFMVLGRML